MIPDSEIAARQAALAKYMAQDHGPRAHAWPAVMAFDREFLSPVEADHDAPPVTPERAAGTAPAATDVDALVVEWRRLRFGGMSAGSQCREMVGLRARLLAAREWRIIYG